MIRHTLRNLRELAGALLDLVVDRYVPDVPAIVFDRDRAERWAEMVDSATVLRGTDAHADTEPWLGLALWEQAGDAAQAAADQPARVLHTLAQDTPPRQS